MYFCKKFKFLLWSSLLSACLLLLPVLNGAHVGSGSDGKSSYSDSTSCQCGVFLLGAPPLQFSEDAKPVLAGDPVSTNCTSPKDRTDCSTICRRLIQSMDNPKSPLFQAVVLTASRALACQRYNSSVNMKVPLPRVHINNPWMRNIGGGDSNTNKREIGIEHEPKWLGGFYRWCDVHWIYAGASVHEPLCCSNGLPTKCPESASNSFSVPGGIRSTARNDQQSDKTTGTGPNRPSFFFSNNRNPRLIIKTRPEDDLSEEEVDDEEDVGGEQPENDLAEPASTAAGTTSPSEDDTANEAENLTSFEKIDPLKIANAAAEEAASKLNSTILAEAFQFVGAIMRTLGFGDVTDGINTVLPSSTATELLKKVDVGGWVGKYQDQYVQYGREYNLGYCYLEYGLYNVASEGVGNMISRVFGGGSGGGLGLGMGNHNLIKTYHRRVERSTSFDQFDDAVGAGQPQPQQQQFNVSKPSKIHTSFRAIDKQQSAKKVKSSRRQQPNAGPNLMNMANMLLQLAAGSGGGGSSDGGGDNVNALLQNALPLMGQVATSPMIQGVVSNLVTSFLTPPDPSNNNNHNNQFKRPPPKNNGIVETNEIDQFPQQQNRPSNKFPPPQQQQQEQESGLTSMLGQIVQTYLKHYFSGGGNTNSNTNNNKTPPSKSPTTSGSSSKPVKNSGSTSTTASTPVAEEKTDIVETISEVAKPFFLSYFGVVPGIPGFGQLNVADRTGRDTLSYDPDPGTSLNDLFWGSVNIPTTGNSIFDFGNRMSFAFGRANDPTQGLFCFKQYTVNKLWDGFRFGVKTLFK